MANVAGTIWAPYPNMVRTTVPCKGYYFAIVVGVLPGLTNQVGLISSTDGINWQYNPTAPLLCQALDESHVQIEGGWTKMVKSIFDAANAQIAAALAQIGGPPVENPTFLYTDANPPKTPDAYKVGLLERAKVSVSGTDVVFSELT